MLHGQDAAPLLEPQQKKKKKKKKRVGCLDALRGVAITLMILANYGSGGPFAHSHWDGLSLADLAMPLFVFSMGCAMAFTTDRQLEGLRCGGTGGAAPLPSTLPLLRRAARRAGKLVLRKGCGRDRGSFADAP